MRGRAPRGSGKGLQPARLPLQKKRPFRSDDNCRGSRLGCRHRRGGSMPSLSCFKLVGRRTGDRRPQWGAERDCHFEAMITCGGSRLGCRPLPESYGARRSVPSCRSGPSGAVRIFTKLLCVTSDVIGQRCSCSSRRNVRDRVTDNEPLHLNYCRPIIPFRPGVTRFVCSSEKRDEGSSKTSAPEKQTSLTRVGQGCRLSRSYVGRTSCP